MKNLKKKIAGILAAVMTFASCGLTAFAAEGDVVTEYGTIPAEYADKTFVAFSGSKAVFAHDEFYGSEVGIYHQAKKYLKDNPVNADGTMANGAKEIKVLMQKDYTMGSSDSGGNLAQLKGNFTLDLNGHTFTQANKKNIFDAEAKPWGTYGVFETHITMKNGSIVIDNGNLIRYKTHNTGAIPKQYTFDFENIDFSVTEAISVTSLVFYDNGDKKTLPTNYDISFNDCSFDLTKTTRNVILFGAQHTSNPDIRINYSVTGGSIKANKMSQITMASFGTSNASIEYKADSASGLYTTITLPSGETAPTVTLTDSEKTLKYAKYSDNEDGTSTYAPGVISEYGVIPPQFAGNTFVAFSGGNALYASDYLYDTKVDGVEQKGIIYYVKENILKNNLKSDGVLKDNAVEAQVLMQKDFTNTVAWSNIAQVRGKVTIDLNQHTLTSTTYLLATQAKPFTNNISDSHIVLKNGNVVLGNYALAYYESHRGSSYAGTATKGYILDIDNVNISLKSGSTLADLIKYNKPGNSTNETLCADYDITFNDCTFDFKNATKKINIFSATHTLKDIYTVDCTINGGNIIKGNYDVVMHNITATGDASFTWGQGADSLYTTLTLPAGNVRPDATVNVNGTDMIYDKVSEMDSYATYKLIPADTEVIKTAYGDILPGHAQDNFAAFSNGKLLFTHNEIFGANNTGVYHLAKEYVKANTINSDGTIAEGAKEVQILQLHDAKLTATYANLAQYKGNITIDLNGKTLTTTKNTTVFSAAAKPWGTYGVFDTNITMKNGKLVLDNGYLINYNTWIGSYTGNLKKKMAFNFENIGFSLADGYSRNALITYSANNLEPIDSVFDISFKDCDFDVTKAVSETMTLFKANHPEEGTSVNYKIEGGSITAKSANVLTVCSLADSNAEAEFIKDSVTGDYMTLILPENAADPREVIDVNGEMMRYTKAALSDGSNAIYKLSALTECEFLDYDIDNKAAKLFVKEAGTYAVVFADYDGDILTGVEIVEKEFAKGIQTVEQENDFTADEIMLWNNLEDMTPLCEPKRVYTIMAIGNSFAQDSVFYLDDIAAADGVVLKSYNLMIGGRTLGEHCNSWDDETDPYTVQVNAGASIGEMTIKDVAEMSDWDYVMLQGTTHNISSDTSTRYDDAFWGEDNETGESVDAVPVWTSLKDNIAATVPGAKRFVHATWSPYEAAAEIFYYGKYKDGTPDSRGAFTSSILERAQLGADIYSTEKRAGGEGAFIPTAVAVDYLIRHYGFPEYEGELDENDRFSQVPDVRGVYRDKTCHLSANVGRVLAGLVWYEMITGTPATENNYERVTLSAEDMAMIKEAAHYACENYMTYNPENVDAYQDAA